MPGLSEAFERTGSVLEHRMPLMHAPGAALAVTDADETLGVVVRGFADVASSSPMRPETRTQIGSISKSFTAISAVQEAEAGRLDLHTSVNDLVPWLGLAEPFGPITMHHLLTHSSGLAIGTEFTENAVVIARHRAAVGPGAPPGERFLYSNDAYKIVGLALEEVTGRHVADLVRERVLAPLGMAKSAPRISPPERLDLATGYVGLYDDRPTHREHPLVPAPWYNSETGDGSIVSSVIDMAAYARMLLHRGGAPEGHILSEEGFRSLTTGYVEDRTSPPWRYAYGFWTGLDPADGRTYLWHSGSMVGYAALLRVDVEAGLAAIMLVNGEGNRSTTVDYALAAVRAAVAGEPLPEPPETPDPLAIAGAERIAGVYTSTDRSVELAATGGGTGVSVRDRGIEVALESDTEAGYADRFLVPHPDLDRYYLRIVRDPDDRVRELTHGGERFVPGTTPPEERSLPGEWAGFPGHYRSANVWVSSIRVVARDGRLWLIDPYGDETDLELVPEGDATFRVGAEPWRTEQVRFEEILRGKARRMWFDGAVLDRSFLP